MPGSGGPSPEEMIGGYMRGWFPMDDEGPPSPVRWFEADPRALLPVAGFRVPATVARMVRRRAYEIRVDAAFQEVTARCGGDRDGTWLTPRLAAAYGRLHGLGLAHSVEAWSAGRLVGGLFGVSLGGLFTSESMFHAAPDAGNAVLVATARRLAERGYELWDVQMAGPHLARFGAFEVSAREYRRLLLRALALPRRLA